MANFFLDIITEDIPAKMQFDFILQLEKKFHKFLANKKIKIIDNDINFFISLNHIVIIANLQQEYIFKNIRKIGPEINSDQEDIDNFLNKNNIPSKEDLDIFTNKNKSFYYFVEKEKKILLEDILKKELKLFCISMQNSWSKLLKFEEYSWIRPIVNIVIIIKDIDNKNKILDLDILGHKANNIIYFGNNLDNKFIFKEDIDDYNKIFLQHNIILSHIKRKNIIIDKIKNILDKDNYNIDFNLDYNANSNYIEELSSMVNNPEILIGKIKKEFLHLDNSIIALTLKNHQKLIALYNSDEKIDRFLIIIDKKDDESKYKKIISDNEKIVDSRLSDILFFIESDQKLPLSQRRYMLQKISLNKNLGNLYDKSIRIINLFKFISLYINNLHIQDLLNKYELSDYIKSDLTTKLVAELPELQGKIGGFYAKLLNLPQELILMIEEQYMSLPNSDIGSVIAIADKIDNITSVFILDELISASKDPFACRKSAISIIKIIIDKKIDISLKLIIKKSINLFNKKIIRENFDIKNSSKLPIIKNDILMNIISFFNGRFKNYLINLGFDKNIINHFIEDDNILSNKKNSYNIYELYNKIEIYNNLLSSDKIASCKNSYKRISSLLSDINFSNKIYINKKLLIEKEEINLYKFFIKLSKNKIFKSNDIAAMFKELIKLDLFLVIFLDIITVNDDNIKIQLNRKNLLYKIKIFMDRFLIN